MLQPKSSPMVTDKPRVGNNIFLRPLGLALAALAIFATACGDSGTGVSGEPDPVTLELAFGDEQVGLQGLPLKEAIVVRTLGPDGTSRTGVPVLFSVLEGGGTLTSGGSSSGADGRIEVGLELGRPGPQRVEVRVDPGWLPTGAAPVALEVSATALGPDETDVIIVRGAPGPLLGAVLLKPFEVEGLVEIEQEWGTSDTIIPLYPKDRGSLDLYLFGQENRVTYARPEFTPSVDTFEITVEPRLPVPILVENRLDEMVDGTSRAVKDLSLQLDLMDEIWAQEGMGITVGEVTVEDLYTGAEVAVEAEEICGRPAVGRWVITMVDRISNGRYLGYACLTGRSWIARRFNGLVTLTAHEVGHTLSLPHVDRGVMSTGYSGREMTIGEAFQANFDERSALNSLLGAQDPSLQRGCFQSRPDNGCLPRGYELPEPIIW